MNGDPNADAHGMACTAWEEAMDRKDHRAAVTIGIDAHVHYRARGDEKDAEAALGLIHIAITQLYPLHDTPPSTDSCSFCGRPRSEVRVGAGPNALICVDCVETFHTL